MSTSYLGAHDQTGEIDAVEAQDADEASEDHLAGPVAGATVLARAGDPVLIPADTLEAPARAAEGSRAGAPRRSRWIDVGVCAVFGLIAFWITHQYWQFGHASAADVSDQAFFEYMLAHAAQSVTHLSNPFYTSQLNVPIGINLMVNTSVLALAVPLTPVTLLFGPAVSFALLMTLGLAATGAAWYFVVSRHVVRSRTAAVVAGLIAGFGPGMVAHAAGHPNIIAQFLVPFIAWRTIKLREQGHAVRNGIALGLLIVAQVFINEEVLFILAIGVAVFLAVCAVSRRSIVRAEIRPFLTGGAIAAGLAGVLLAYPLWWQFFGPNTYHGLSLGVKAFSTDLGAFPAFGTRTIFGTFTNDPRLSQSVAEQNTFLGWPLLIACGVAIYWLRRSIVARALAISGLVLGVLSLGPEIKFDGKSTGIIGPWRLLNDLPIFNSAVPTRFSLLILPIVAVLIAMAHDRARSLGRVSPEGLETVRPSTRRAVSVRPRQAYMAWSLLLAVALVAIIPTPVPTKRLDPTPAFFASAEWKHYVKADQTVLPVPLPGPGVVDSMFWAADSQLSFSMPRGYFLGPDPQHGDVAFFGAPSRPTADLLAEVISDGFPAIVHKADRAAAIKDLRYWRVAVIVVVPDDPNEKPLKQTLSDLVGIKPKFVGGVWVWDVRSLVAKHGHSDLE